MEPCHPLVVWKDCRSKDLCSEWNDSWTVKLLNAAGRTAHFFTRAERFKAAKMFQFLSGMVTHRFTATFDKDPSMQELLKKNKLRIGCLETWLLLKLTKGTLIVAEASCASATGMFDPYLNDWGYTILKLIRFPSQILPKVVDSATEKRPLAITDSTIFGFPLPIGGIVSLSSALTAISFANFPARRSAICCFWFRMPAKRFCEDLPRNRNFRGSHYGFETSFFNVRALSFSWLEI